MSTIVYYRFELIKLQNLTILHFKCYSKSLYITIVLKQKKFIALLLFRVKSLKIVSIASSVMKNIVVLSFQSRFSLKLICCIGFGSTSRACCLFRYIATSYYNFWNKYNLVNHWSNIPFGSIETFPRRPAPSPLGCILP